MAVKAFKTPPAVAIVSLGCAKNLVDTEHLLGELYARNFRLEAEPERAQVAIVNSCGFLGSAGAETRDTLSELLALKGKGSLELVFVMGCYVSRGTEDLKKTFPDLDGAYALNESEKIAEDLFSYYAPKYPSLGKRPLAGVRPISATLAHYSYLKISEGCDRVCTYCTIPSIRGAQKDQPIAKLVEETRRLADRGVVELNIIAQDTTAYGLQSAKKPKLLELLQALVKVKGIKWFRLLYAYPDYLTPELASFLQEHPKILPYLELPIQHTHPSVLKRMARKDTFELYDSLFELLRKNNPDYALRSTVIVGFPGETEEEFLHLLNYLRKRKFDRLGAFCYSAEPKTPAYRLPNQVPKEVIEERYDRVMRLQQSIHFEANQAWQGRDIEFIVDELGGENAVATGRSYRDAVDIDARIHITHSSAPLHAGMIATCRVSGIRDYDLEGVL